MSVMSCFFCVFCAVLCVCFCMGHFVMLPLSMTLSILKPVLSSHQEKHIKWPLKAGGCLMEVNIKTKLKFGNILYGCLRQVRFLIKVTANTGLTVHCLKYFFFN